MNIALVEDDADAVENIRKHCETYAAENIEWNYSITVFGDGLDFLDKYKPVYDVVFMDIEMPYLNGMDAAKRLREFDPSVILIFITNLKQFALKGYEVEAMDFLVKPVAYTAFKTMLGRVNRRVENTAGDSITITNAKGTYRLRTSDIYYIEIIKHYLVIHTVSGEKQFFGSLTDIEQKLPRKSFARCNNCYLVNLAWVQKVGQEDVYVGGDALKMSRGKKNEFKMRLLEYMNG